MNERYVVLAMTAAALHESTLALATRLAAASNAVLVFFHVGEVGGAAALSHGEPAHERVRPADSTVSFRHRTARRDGEDELAAFVSQHDVGFLVIEEAPRRGLSTRWRRSFAERIVQRVDCPVVIGGPGFVRSAAPVTVAEPVPPQASDLAMLLNATVDARVQALSGWMRRSASAVQEIAASETLQTLACILESGGRRIPESLTARARYELDEHRRALCAVGWQLQCGEQRWGDRTGHASEGSVPASAAYDAFLGRVDTEGSSCSLPLLSVAPGVELSILAGARLGDHGRLILAFDAERDFLRILGQPGPLPCFETYAFDAQGLMLSKSRFAHHLVATGLLPDDGAQTPLRLRVAEPSAGPKEGWPLTRMVRDALRSQGGFDTRGYLDYRGTRVVGAWRWLREYGFGVAAEVDHASAFPSA